MLPKAASHDRIAVRFFIATIAVACGCADRALPLDDPAFVFKGAPWFIATDSANVYVSNGGFHGGQILRIDKQSHVVSKVGEFEGTVGGLAADGAGVYWADTPGAGECSESSRGRILKLAKDTAEPEVVATATCPLEMVVSGGDIYWTSWEAHRGPQHCLLHRTDSTNHTTELLLSSWIETLSAGDTGLSFLTSDESPNAYFAIAALSEEATGPVVSILVRGLTGAFQLVSGAGTFFWISPADVIFQSAAAGTPKPLPDSIYSAHLAARGAEIYSTTVDGAVRRWRGPDSTPEVLLKANGGRGGRIVVDESGIYWVALEQDVQSGSVYRLKQRD